MSGSSAGAFARSTIAQLAPPRHRGYFELVAPFV
jgi:hypothetical protein